MRNKLTIVKVGGGIINDKIILNQFLKDFSKIEGMKLLVNGGGLVASDNLNKLGIDAKLINGRRITDGKTLDVIIMTYAGLLNKNIVAKLQKYNCNTIGLSGVDCNLIRGKKRVINEIDYGFVGDIEEVNVDIIKILLNSNITPVVCSLSHDGQGQILNTNADSITSVVSIALSKEFDVTLKYCFDKPGLLIDQNDESSIKKYIRLSEYKDLINKNIITDGMIQKIENCFSALEKGVENVFIGNHNIINEENNCTKLTLE